MATEEKQRYAFERTVVELLTELLAWTKLEARPRAAARLADILDSDEKKLAYQYSDGRRVVREISQLTGVDKNTISTWCREWDGLGIMEQAKTRKGRRQRLVSLESVGIEVPPLPRGEEK
ncbi:MAG: hypothetical protein CEE40_03645 [Chloroflexi bacterium B3_Chlor]|nr:MAG: hypothetical protein CEE40_03645 [Chloroflexi bacterium B3_Chlor]